VNAGVLVVTGCAGFRGPRKPNGPPSRPARAGRLLWGSINALNIRGLCVLPADWHRRSRCAGGTSKSLGQCHTIFTAGNGSRPHKAHKLDRQGHQTHALHLRLTAVLESVLRPDFLSDLIEAIW